MYFDVYLRTIQVYKMHQKIPVIITIKQIQQLNGFSESTARREVNAIRDEFTDAGKPVPKKITIAMYADWSGIKEEKILEFLKS